MPSSEVMPKFKKGKLHSGSKGGPVVRNPAQARAIAASEGRKEKEHGGKYPHPKKGKKGKRGGMTRRKKRQVLDDPMKRLREMQDGK